MKKRENLKLKKMELGKIPLWDKNPKLHDFGSIIQSIHKYGFQDPPKYDQTLGGLVSGNGRVQALRMMKEDGYPAPSGVEVREDGEWLVPVMTGNDLQSEAEATAYALDHNNLTMLGGDGFTAIDVGRMWDRESYQALLMEVVHDPPVSVDGEDMDLLMSVFTNGSLGSVSEEKAAQGENKKIEKSETSTNSTDVDATSTHVDANPPKRIMVTIPPDELESTYQEVTNLLAQIEGVVWEPI